MNIFLRLPSKAACRCLVHFFLFLCRGSLPESLSCNAACFRASGLDFSVKFCKEKWTTITINNHLLPNHYFTTARCRRTRSTRVFRKEEKLKTREDKIYTPRALFLRSLTDKWIRLYRFGEQTSVVFRSLK